MSQAPQPIPPSPESGSGHGVPRPAGADSPRSAGAMRSTDAGATPERRDRGHYFEEFKIGQVYRHHWGRTVTEAESLAFTTGTGNANPLYFNIQYAKAHGHTGLPVDPLLAWNIVFGLTVEDLSLKVAGAGNLGYPVIRFLRTVYPGDTLYAESEVLATGPWKGADDCGVVHVRTIGRNQEGDAVLEYERKILVRKRGAS